MTTEEIAAISQNKALLSLPLALTDFIDLLCRKGLLVKVSDAIDWEEEGFTQYNLIVNESITNDSITIHENGTFTITGNV